MAASSLKIGWIASRLRISVRTLRHYDAIGLLSPSSRTPAGHRLYTERELLRLQKIVALRRMGFSLEHVRAILSGDTRKAYSVLEAQAHRLRGQITRHQEILNRVDVVLGAGERRHAPFDNQEVEAMKKQAAELREALMREMERGSDPKDPYVQDLVQQLENLWTSAFRVVKDRMDRFESFPRQRQLDGLTQALREMRMFGYLYRARA